MNTLSLSHSKMLWFTWLSCLLVHLVANMDI